jgi:hypothetical protein
MIDVADAAPSVAESPLAEALRMRGYALAESVRTRAVPVPEARKIVRLRGLAGCGGAAPF